MRRSLLGLGFVFVLTACGAHRSYRLPVAAYEAYKTFAPIASVADSKGLRYAEFDESVHVQLDDATWIYYRVANDKYNMVIMIDDDQVPPDEQPKKFEWAKKEADDIWEKAMAAYRGMNPGTAPAAVPPINIDVNL